MDNLALNSPILFGAGGNFQKYSLRGWSAPDNPTRTWNDGHVAELDFRNGLLKRDPVFRLLATPFLMEPDLRFQELTVYLNGLWITYVQATNDIEILVPVPRNHFNSQRNVLSFVMPRATCPMEEGWNADERRLAFAFEQVELTGG